MADDTPTKTKPTMADVMSLLSDVATNGAPEERITAKELLTKCQAHGERFEARVNQIMYGNGTTQQKNRLIRDARSALEMCIAAALRNSEVSAGNVGNISRSTRAVGAQWNSADQLV